MKVDLKLAGNSAVVDGEIQAYPRLTVADRAGAEALRKFCHATGAHEEVARRLSNISLAQSLISSIPLAVADFSAIWLTLYASTAVTERLLSLPTTLMTQPTSLLASLLLLPMAELAGVYPGLGANPIVEFRQVVRAAALALMAYAGIGIFLFPHYGLFFFLSALLTLLLCVAILPAVRFTVRTLLGKTKFWGAPVLIYASPAMARELYHRMRRSPDRGLRPVGVLLAPEDYWKASNDDAFVNIPTYDVRNALECADENRATWVIVGPQEPNSDEESSIDAAVYAIPNRVHLASAQLELGMWDHAYSIGYACGLRVAGVRPNTFGMSVKRVCDFVAALLLLILSSPFFAAMAAAIKLSSPGPVFYGQQRIGRNGRPFTAWKFRTMHVDAEAQLEAYLASNLRHRQEWEQSRKLKTDPRVTRVGNFLRRTSLDELPQLWNVLRGEMSLVGPRPIVDSPTYDAEYILDYPAEFAAYKTVRPGLTGLWQVTCRNSGVYEMRIYWDMYYLRNWSLWLDLYILLRTVRTVLLREGAY